TVVAEQDAVAIDRPGANDDQEGHYYFAGSEDTPALIDVRAGPGKPSIPHAHGSDEIVYILEGSLILGRRICGPGTAILVPANTLYCFRVGSEGVRYLNFRPRRDDSYIRRDELLDARSLGH